MPKIPSLHLGKAEPKLDPRTLQAARFMALPTRPKSVLYGSSLKWPMYANDQYGCCVIAGKWHMIEAWTRGYTTTNAKIVAEYMRLSGGADSGLVMLDALNDWRKSSTHPIHAYAQVNHASPGSVSDAIYLFGGVFLGVALPQYLQNRMDHGHWEWTMPTGDDQGSHNPNSWGGHAVNLVGFNSKGVWVITWGRRIFATWEFVATFADESYGIISLDWFTKQGRDRHGFNLTQLDSDLAAL